MQYDPPKLIGQVVLNARRGKKSAVAAAGAFKFKKSGSANAAEKRNRTDSEGRSGFGANTFKTRPQKGPRKVTQKAPAFRTPESRAEMLNRMKPRKIYGLRMIDRGRKAKINAMRKGK